MRQPLYSAGTWSIAAALWAAALALSPSDLAAATYYVSTAGSDSAGNGTTGSPWASVTNALANASANDTILVGGGVYTQQVSFTGKVAVTVRGGHDGSWNWDPSNQTTVIFGNGVSPVLIPGGAESNTLSYLTLKGGNGGNEAGIKFQGLASNLFVEGCTLISNYCGIYSLAPQTITLRNTLIARNSSHGIYFNFFAGQGTPAAAGYCYMYNCTVADNGGHGFMCQVNPDWLDIVPVIRNSVFTGNNGYGLWKRGNSDGGSISNCLFYGNAYGPLYTTSLYYSGTPIVSLGGIKSRDPQYVDRAAGNYRLQGTSPAAAAGLDLTSLGVTNDIANAARPQGTWDIGAYEGSGAGEGSLLAEAYVRTNGSDTTGTGTSGNPFATVNHALSLVAPSGTVHVAAGTYGETVQFGPDKQQITIRGAYDPSWNWDPSNQTTVIDGNGLSPVVLAPGANSNALSYLTLKRGTGSDGLSSFAGIRFIGAWNSLSIEGCTIVSNYYGIGSSYCQPASLTIRNTLIARNTSRGIYLGISFTAHSTAPLGYCRLYNCTVADNGSDGFWCNCQNSDWGDIVPVARNSIFAGNAGYGIIKWGQCSNATIENCLFYANTSGAYTDPGSGYGGPLTDLGGEKMGRDPLFVNGPALDYRIQTNSPAATAGLDLSGSPYFLSNDIMNVSRPLNGWDMGAFEGDGVGEPTPLNLAYVSATTGSDTTGNGSSTNPYASIGVGLGHITPSGTVYVAGGIYVESVQVGSDKKGAAIRGGYTPVTWTWDPAGQFTVIDGNGLSPVIVAAAANSNVLSYLTLKRGTAAGDAAGIQFSGTAPTLFVEGCTIVSNRYGIYSPNGMPQNVTFKNTLIARNNSHAVFFNLGSWQGYDTTLAYCRFYNCTVADNGGHGFLNHGGINPDWSDEVPQAIDSIFTGNNGYGIYKRGTGPGFVVSNCLFYANINGPVYAHTPMASGGNKTRPPKYVDPAGLNYRLQAASPAAGAGQDISALGVTNDLANTSRPQGTAWDMGAFEAGGSGEPPLTNEAYVATTGSDTSGNGSSTNPWATISFALPQVAPFGAVRVAAGTYTETVAFGPDRQSVTVRGGYAPGSWTWDPASQVTVIDGNGRAPVAVGPAAMSNTISYVTLRGGTGTDVANNRFAGIYFTGPYQTLFVDGCTVVSNWYGIFSYYRMPEVVVARNSLFATNTSHGIYFAINVVGQDAIPAGYSYLYNCTVADNGGNGVMTDWVNADWRDVVPVAKNTLFTGNNGYGIWKGGASTNGSYEYCLFSSNALGAITNRGWAAATDLGNNLSAVPLYYNKYGIKNYRLWQTSPAHNSGLDLSALGITLDIEGYSRPDGAIYDRGAYERAISPFPGTVFVVH